MYKKAKTANLLKLLSLIFVLLCTGLLTQSALADNNPVGTPIGVELTCLDDTPFGSPQDIMLNESFYIRYNFADVIPGVIDSTLEYPLPDINSNLVFYSPSGEDPADTQIYADDGGLLGVLRFYPNDSQKLTFQFDERFDSNGVTGLYLKFLVTLDKDSGSAGDTIRLEFPIADGSFTQYIHLVDPSKTPPDLTKKGPGAGADGIVTDFDPLTNRITWTITVEHGENPYDAVQVRDTYNDTQEFVSGSFMVDGTAVTEGLSVDETTRTLNYDLTGLTVGGHTVISYQTQISNTAFLNANGVPKTSGDIRCNNIAQIFEPDGQAKLTDEATATYNHPISWIYKTSTNVIDRLTGEMEWTITINSNGLSMTDVVLYDRLSPGISVVENTATMQVGNNSAISLPGFARTSAADILYQNKADYAYNLNYTLPGTISGITVIKYTTIITDPEAYDATQFLPPDSLYNNRAFISYKMDGGGNGGTILSPVVSKDAANSAGVLGKIGTIDKSTHTIQWTLSVNTDKEFLENVTITDTLTPAGTTITTPSTYTAYDHVFSDLNTWQPYFTTEGGTKTLLTPYNAAAAGTPFTYQVSGTGGDYSLVFRLGNLNGVSGTITCRSTVTDPNIYAKNIVSNKYAFENKAVLSTTNNFYGFASANVLYSSKMLEKANAADWYNKLDPAYIYDENAFAWQVIINQNFMAMSNICLVDVLPAGTSLIADSVRLGLGNQAHYYLATTIPEKTSDGQSRPYYTYDAATREIRIYLEDIPSSVAGTAEASKRIAFYTRINYDDPALGTPNATTQQMPLSNDVTLLNDYIDDGTVTSTKTVLLPRQLTAKSGTPYKNGENFSIDYSVNINRAQITLPENAKVEDILPDGLRVNLATVKLYSATVNTSGIYEPPTLQGEAGTMKKGAEIDPALYSADIVAKDDGTSTFTVSLPADAGTNMYILEYSCDVLDLNKAPFKNQVSLVGVEASQSGATIERAQLVGAGGGGTLMGAIKTHAAVTKLNVVTNQPVEGAVFGLYYRDKLLQQATTDAEGKIKFDKLDSGLTYTIKELSAPSSYFQPVDISETFVASATEPISLIFTNTPRAGNVRFLKTDVSGAPLSGATFGVWGKLQAVGDDAPLKTTVSGADGTVEFNGLSAGHTYYIGEISAPEGYIVTDTILEAAFNEDGLVTLYVQGDAQQTQVTSLANEAELPTGDLTVSKMIAGTGASTTQAFTFTVTLTDRSITGLYGQITFTNGVAIFTLRHGQEKTAQALPVGISYTVTETTVDDWTAINASRSGTITEAGSSLSFLNIYVPASTPTSTPTPTPTPTPTFTPGGTPNMGDDSRSVGVFLFSALVLLQALTCIYPQKRRKIADKSNHQNE